MTCKTHPLTPRAKIKSKLSVRFGACYMCVFLLVLFLKNTEATVQWVSNGLDLCVKRLVPSLFPFMVVSSLMVLSGAGTRIFKVFERPVRCLFGVGAECCAPILLGWLSGFPVGARCASELSRNRVIGAEEYKRVLCISSTPSPAFLIGTVGSGMLKKPFCGVILYFLSLFSCLTVGVFFRIKSGSTDSVHSLSTANEHLGFARALTRAVTESAQGMLYVCAFIVFFSAFLGTLEGTLAFLGLSNITATLIFCFFEMTSGISRLCALNPPPLHLLALAAGWSGMSVHFQTAAMCSSEQSVNNHLFAYVISHIAKAAICFFLALLIGIFV